LGLYFLATRLANDEVLAVAYHILLLTKHTRLGLGDGIDAIVTGNTTSNQAIITQSLF
jgi:hypothetical protein